MNSTNFSILSSTSASINDMAEMFNEPTFNKIANAFKVNNVFDAASQVIKTIDELGNDGRHLIWVRKNCEAILKDL